MLLSRVDCAASVASDMVVPGSQPTMAESWELKQDGYLRKHYVFRNTESRFLGEFYPLLNA